MKIDPFVLAARAVPSRMDRDEHGHVDRPYLTGVLIDRTEEPHVAVATDGHRLHAAPVRSRAGASELTHLAPEVARYQGEKKPKADDFVQWRPAVPAIGSMTWTCRAGVGALRQAIRLAASEASFAVDGRGRGIALTADGSVLRVGGLLDGPKWPTSDHPVPVVDVAVPVERGHQFDRPIRAAFHARYLLDAMTGLAGTREVHLALSNCDLDPVRVDRPDGSYAVVMPVRVR